MNINRNNYEEFFIDYIDGKLTAEEVAELMLFVAANPDLREELNMLEQSPVLELAGAETFNNKEQLKKKEFSPLIINEAIVAEFEGIAGKEDLEVLRNIPANQLEHERKLVALTKFHPNLEIVFPDKNKLKHETKVISLLYYYASAAAACLLIMFGAYRWFNTNDVNKNNLASNLPKTEINKEIIANKNTTSTAIEPLVKQNNFAYNKVKKQGAGKKINSSTRKIDTINNSVLENQNMAYVPQNKQSQPNENNEPKKVELENNLLDLDKNLILAQVPEENKVKSITKSTPVTPTEFVYKNVTGELPEEGKENRLMNFARFAAAGIEKISGKQARAQKTKKDCGTKYNFKIGGVEFERTIACK